MAYDVLTPIAPADVHPTTSHAAPERPSLAPLGEGIGPPNGDLQGTSADPTSSAPASRRPSPKGQVRGRKATASDLAQSIYGAPSPTLSVPPQDARSTEDHAAERGDDQHEPADQCVCVVAQPSDPANALAHTSVVAPNRGDAHPPAVTRTTGGVANHSPTAIVGASPISALPSGGDARSLNDNLHSSVVATIIDLWRQRQDLTKAARRLDLQCQAICRRVSGGDKELAGKLWSKVQRKPDGVEASLLAVLEPYRAALAPLTHHAAALEKQLAREARKLPLWTCWAKDVRGLGELSLAGLIGEAAGLPGDYRSVSAVWKRFGLAVIDGGRQRRVGDAAQALVHGYSPERRAYAYVLSTNLMRCQRTGDEYRDLYDRRKAYELNREIPKAHAHNRALRVMVKELLKDAWKCDRRTRGIADV